MAVERKKKLSASLEDYLEAIFNLAGQAEGARCTDIAERLGVSKASVTGALQSLKKKGLANYEPYGCVTLTRSGQKAAAEVANRNKVLMSFFVDVLGVDVDAAQQAACKAEHALGAEIIARLLHLREFVTESDKSGRCLTKEFMRFCDRSGQGLDAATSK